MPTDSKLVKAVSKQIDKIRRERGLSYQEMAFACDLEKSQAHKLCNGGINVTINTLQKIAKGLEVTVQELFDFK